MNLFSVLKLNCYSSKREIEEAFLAFCDKLDERENEIKYKIEHIKDGADFTASEEVFFDKTIEAHKEMLEKMESVFTKLGIEYETIMDGSIDDRFEYLLENISIYSLLGLSYKAAPEEINKAIQKRVSACIAQMNSEDPDIVEMAQNEKGILERFKGIIFDPKRKEEYDKKIEQKREGDLEKVKDNKIIRFIRPLAPKLNRSYSDWTSPMMPSYMPQSMDEIIPTQPLQSNNEERPQLNIDYTYGYHPNQLQNNNYIPREVNSVNQMQGYVDSNGIFRAMRPTEISEYKMPESAGTGEQIHRNKRRVVNDINERAKKVPIEENVSIEGIHILSQKTNEARKKTEEYIPKHQAKTIKKPANLKKIAALILTAALIGTAVRSCDVVKDNNQTTASAQAVHARVETDSLATAYSMLEPGNLIKTAIEKSYQDTTGIKNLNYITEYIEDVERHILSGTYTKEHIRFMYNMGLNTTKASIAEGKNINASNIILYCNNLASEASVLIGNKSYSANFYDMNNSKLSRQLLENIRTIGAIQDMMNGEQVVENYMKDLKMQVTTLCMDSYCGYITYGEQDGKLGFCVEKSKNRSENTNRKIAKNDEEQEL